MPEPQSASPAAGEKPAVSACIEDGRLATRLFGAIQGDISWESADMTCEGMPRPGGEGARLRFSGPHPSGDGTLVLIAAIPGLERDKTASELPARLTIIKEGQSRFFTSPDFDICWADIERSEYIDDAGYALDGRIYCIAPINEVNGSATITVADILFAGHIDWDAS